MGTVFLFGAGASNGSGPCRPHPPPLGRDLFSELSKLGGVAASVEPDLAARFASDFEDGMAEFFNRRNAQVSALLREMASYFAQFLPAPGNHYRRLIDLLARSQRGAVICTTNYDLLIELAISEAGWKVAYQAPPVPPRNFPVVKIHGSCNFLPDLGSGAIRGLSFEINDPQVGKDSAILEAPIRPATTPARVLEFCAQEDSIAPAISLYARGKRILYCPTFIQQQQSIWQAEVEKATRVFVIGLRINPEDQHIWHPLARTRASIAYVGREPRRFEEWAKDCRSKYTGVLAESFEDSLPLLRNQLVW